MLEFLVVYTIVLCLKLKVILKSIKNARVFSSIYYSIMSKT
ncbi:hypothetical protein [Campylobacter phage CP20]|uniref:Uncharacterized protein n=1 Tax=Campylobacter phage CP20 TaxID=2506428 RepID=A0A410T7E4_9CAUD|nr:hypothetical protein [Campylobacter phage CP20]